MNQSHILIAANKNYLVGLCITIGSLLNNYKGDNQLVFHIVSSDFDASDYENLNLYLNEISPSQNFLLRKVECETLSDNVRFMPDEAHFSIESNARLYVFDLFKNVSKVFYIDCDLFFNFDFSSFENFDLQDHAIGVCKGFHDYTFQDWNKDNPHITIPKEMIRHEYFNAGIMIFDMDACRNRSLDQSLKHFLKSELAQNSFSDSDQFVCNYVFHEHWIDLPSSFNHRIFLNRPLESHANVIQNCVYHFVGAVKPWHIGRTNYKIVKFIKQFISKTNLESFIAFQNDKLTLYRKNNFLQKIDFFSNRLKSKTKRILNIS